MRALMRDEKRFTMIQLMVAIVMVSFLAMVPLAHSGDGSLIAHAYWVQKWETFGAKADQAVSAGDVLSMNRITGTIGKAAANTGVSTYVVGLAGNTAAKGAPVEIVRSGILSGLAVPAWGNNGITPYGAPVFLSTSAGGVTVYGKQNGYTAGLTIFLGTVLPQSDYAQRSGVSSGSDTVLINVPFPSGVSPLITKGPQPPKNPALAEKKPEQKWKVLMVSQN